ncbi:MAG: prepilin-type N-terminal cleavage/methylation domain-containing protein [Candidatus Paceibacterota bacterium]|jgi:prepilin-type N-terminal cleavage/methylation domain-containing protein
MKIFFIKKNIKNKNGYTLIETMISISLFLIIVMEGMGALLNANLLHQKSQNMRSVVDNLSFVMEDISRNLRTGYSYHCITGADDLTNLGVKSGNSCWGIAFDYQGHQDGLNDKWIYEIVSENRGGITVYYIRKSINSGATWVQLTPDEIAINTTASSFTITGAEPPNADGTGDHQQPFVTIKLVGSITLKNIVSPFTLQTSVSQRVVDI